MMIGSMLLNFWAALFSFTVYFLLNFQKQTPPVTILIWSFVMAIIGFVVMFIIRYIIGYIFYTPEEDTLNIDIELAGNYNEQATERVDEASNLSEQNSEEIAKVVKTMMNS
nr:hypothetical protein [Lysinibacillus timonensis]